MALIVPSSAITEFPLRPPSRTQSAQLTAAKETDLVLVTFVSTGLR